jgi:hypothetical protein
MREPLLLQLAGVGAVDLIRARFCAIVATRNGTSSGNRSVLITPTTGHTVETSRLDESSKPIKLYNRNTARRQTKQVDTIESF